MHEHPHAAARRDGRRRQDHQVVQVGRRCGEAGRQSVRDRDRQSVDGSAGDRSRHPQRDPRARRRSRAGRRHRWRDRRRRRSCRPRRQRTGCGRRRSAEGARAAPQRHRELRRRPNRRNSRSSSIHSSRCERRNAISDRRGFPAEFLSRRWRGGSRAKPASIFRRLQGSGPHGRIVARDVETAPRPHPAPSHAAGAERPDRRSGQGALRSRRATKRCRSTACARPLRRGFSRRSKPFRIST